MSQPLIVLGHNPNALMEATLTHVFTRVLRNLSELETPAPDLIETIQSMQATRCAVQAAVVSPQTTPDAVATLHARYKGYCENAYALALQTQDQHVIGAVKHLVEFSGHVDSNYPRVELSN